MQKGHLGKRTIMILPRKEAVLLLTVTRTFLCNVLSQFEWQPFMVVVSLNNTFNTNLSIFYQVIIAGNADNLMKIMTLLILYNKPKKVLSK